MFIAKDFVRAERGADGSIRQAADQGFEEV